jgi:hypothetical protein
MCLPNAVMIGIVPNSYVMRRMDNSNRLALGRHKGLPSAKILIFIEFTILRDRIPHAQ